MLSDGNEATPVSFWSDIRSRQKRACRLAFSIVRSSAFNLYRFLGKDQVIAECPAGFRAAQ